MRAESRVRAGTARSGVVHVNVRHRSHFTVVGNHLAQHRQLSLTARGLALYIQSLPPGAPIGIKTLCAVFPEGEHRIAGALRELEEYGYLTRTRERLPSGRVVTRTVSYNQPGAHRNRPTGPGPGPGLAPAPDPAPDQPPPSADPAPDRPPPSADPAPDRQLPASPAFEARGLGRSPKTTRLRRAPGS
ncbi:hypothetical protein ACWCQL_36805, partial [Streptomyces sp. NPDC002073]